MNDNKNKYNIGIENPCFGFLKDKIVTDKKSKTEPKLPERVNHCMGLYTRINSDLFIDDLTPDELRQVANHMEWFEENNKNL